MNKFKDFWNKNFLNKTIVIFCGLLLGSFFSINEKNSSILKDNEIQINFDKPINTESKIDVCDGINITSNCVLNGIEYQLYKYYPPEDEKYHYETKVTYETKIVGYCTLCRDGTRSPSCSTGRGTCSHHGGVAEWNAPIYDKVEHKEQVKIIDSPFKEERYEKITKK